MHMEVGSVRRVRGMFGAWSARARRLSPTNSGGICFVEVLMSKSCEGKHLQCARRVGTVG